MLLFGFAGYIVTGSLSTKTGGKKEKEGESHLSGEGSPKLADFFLHGHVFTIRVGIAPSLINERINEFELREYPKIVNQTRQKQPLGQLSRAVGGLRTIINAQKKRSQRRWSNSFIAPQPHNIYIHHCCTKDLFAVRCISQFFWLFDKILSSKVDINEFLTFYSEGTLITNTNYSDNHFKEEYVVLCVCGKDRINAKESEIVYNAYIDLLHRRLSELSNENEKRLNALFPGLQDECNGNTEIDNDNNNENTMNTEMCDNDNDDDNDNTMTNTNPFHIQCQPEYCSCRKPDDGKGMIFCEICKEWFHYKCVKISEAEANAMSLTSDPYVCPTCTLI